MRYFLFISFFLMISCGNSSDNSNSNKQESTSSNDTKRIIYFGDSLTAGYGLLDYEDAWPHVLTKRIKAEGYSYQMTNAGVSGDTTSGGLGRLEWVLAEKPSIFVLELGANDMLRGISPSVTKENLRSMIRQVKSQYPSTKILLVGMYATPNMGKNTLRNLIPFIRIYPRKKVCLWFHLFWKKLPPFANSTKRTGFIQRKRVTNWYLIRCIRISSPYS